MASRKRTENPNYGDNKYSALGLDNYGEENYHLFDPKVDRSKWTDSQVMTEARRRGAVMTARIPQLLEERREAAFPPEDREALDDNIYKEYKAKLHDSIRHNDECLSVIMKKPETQSALPLVLGFCGFMALIFFIMAMK